MSTNGCGEGFEDWWGALQGETQRGERIGFAIRRLSDGKVVGTSSYLNIRKLHKGLEVGSTFLHPDARSGPINPESKRLLLGHAFAAGAIRVEFMIDVRNARSQAAVEKLGARQGWRAAQSQDHLDRPRPRHRRLRSCDADWPGVKQRLDFRLQESFV